MSIPNHTIVSNEWLNQHLNDDDLIILDASKTTGSDLDRRDEIQIIGSQKFNIKGYFSDIESPYPNMLCSPKQFQINCRKMGINHTSNIVIYDKLGIYSSPRAWWMFKTMGHERVSVLDGGLPNWIAQGFPTEHLVFRNRPIGNFVATFKADNIKSFSQLQANILSQDFEVVDARSSDRFNALVDEPRKGLRRGRIASSTNIPYKNVLDGNNFKSAEEIAKTFNKVNATQKQRTYSCGSGGSACILLLAAEIAGITNNSLYDGSWTEWAQRTTD